VTQNIADQVNHHIRIFHDQRRVMRGTDRIIQPLQSCRQLFIDRQLLLIVQRGFTQQIQIAQRKVSECS
jgi:hypothetical protein